MCMSVFVIFFFFNDTATTEIYTLSLHDALPIYHRRHGRRAGVDVPAPEPDPGLAPGGDSGSGPPRAGDPLGGRDRKSTRLNSSHANISYAVFCLKKKKNSSPL